MLRRAKETQRQRKHYSLMLEKDRAG